MFSPNLPLFVKYLLHFMPSYKFMLSPVLSRQLFSFIFYWASSAPLALPAGFQIGSQMEASENLAVVHRNPKA